MVTWSLPVTRGRFDFERHRIVMPSVSVSGVTKIYPGEEPVLALDGVSFDVGAGEMVALMGPSGCGKSSLLNLIGCVDLPTLGTITLAGRVTAGLPERDLTLLRRDRVGTIFQNFNLLPALRVEENVALPLVLQKRPRLEIVARVAAALEAVGLSSKARAYPAHLSGGQAQRAAVARALIHGPAVILADEPTGSLDSKTAETVLELLRTAASNGPAVLLATHSAKAASFCDRVLAMSDGRLLDG